MSTAKTTQPASRPGGRTERNRQAVAEACLRLLEAGETTLLPARVADEAGVSLSTIYRRWPTRSDLLREALSLHTNSVEFRETGAFESDVHALARTLARFFSQPAEIEMSAAMATNADPEYTHWQIEFYNERFEEAGAPFQRAIERGELSSDVDVEMLLELLFSPMIMRTVIMREKLTAAWVKRLAEGVIRAARA